LGGGAGPPGPPCLRQWCCTARHLITLTRTSRYTSYYTTVSLPSDRFHLRGESTSCRIESCDNVKALCAHLCKISQSYFRLHRMHDMQTIVTDDPGVCLSRGSTRLHCAKMAERIKMLFGVLSCGPKEHCIGRGFRCPHSEGRGIPYGLRQITLAFCFLILPKTKTKANA